jgi:hypothetical protein
MKIHTYLAPHDQWTLHLYLSVLVQLQAFKSFPPKAAHTKLVQGILATNKGQDSFSTDAIFDFVSCYIEQSNILTLYFHSDVAMSAIPLQE